MSSDACTLSGPVVIKLMREVKQILAQPPEGIQLHFSEENISLLHFDLTGPVDTPFAGGAFRIRLQLPNDYPQSAPKGWFLTKIFHPNVNAKSGEICVSTLKKDWVPSLGLRHVLVSIRCLLIEPNPESALNEDAGKLLLENYADYFSRAKMMTKVHAKAGAAAAAEEAAAGPSAVAPAADGVSKDLAATPAQASAVTLGEEENVHSASASASLDSQAKKAPLSVSTASNSASAAAASAGPAAAAPAKVVSAASAAAAAAEAKAKAAKKKAMKRL